MAYLVEAPAPSAPGVKDKYDSLYEQHQPGIYAYFLHRTSNQWHAEDLTSETFFRGFRAIDRYQPTGIPIKFWFFAIARNLLVDYYKGTPPASLDTMLPADGRRHSHPRSFGETILDENVSGDPVIQAEHTLMAMRLREAIEKLSPDYQRVVTMYYLEERSYKEIAQITGQSKGSLKIASFRAIGKLRGILADQDL